MNSKDTIKALIPVWGIPLGIVITVRLFTPDPGQTKNDFPSVVFTPSKIEMLEKQGSKRSNFFKSGSTILTARPIITAILSPSCIAASPSKPR